MDNTLVSIIVPVFNLENYIATCLDSLLAQTYPHLEILVVDDGSTDSSWHILSNYAANDQRIIAIRQENGGAGKARNTALKIMKGEFFTFVDGDDVLSEDTVELNLSFLMTNPALDWVAFPIYRINYEGKKIRSANNYSGFIPIKEQILQMNELIPAFIANELSGLACGAIYRRSAMGDLRFPAGEYYEDSFYFTDVLTHTYNAIISIYGIYGYLERSGSSQLTSVDQKRLQSKVNMLHQRIEKWSIIYPDGKTEYRKWESNMYYYLKTAISKKIIGADALCQKFERQMQYSIKRNMVTEMKITGYKLIGYHRLKKFIENLIKRK